MPRTTEELRAYHREWSKKRLRSDEKWRSERNLAAAEWRRKNLERVAAYNSAYKKSNRQRINETDKKWKKNNTERWKRLRRAHYERHRFAMYEKSAAYRHRKKASTPIWANRFFMEEIYHLAHLRTRLLGMPHQVDHIVPLNSKIVCGLHCEANLRVIPAIENTKKSNRTWPDMPEKNREPIRA